MQVLYCTGRNLEQMTKRKRQNIALIVLFSAVGLFLLVYYASFINSSEVCGVYIRESGIRSTVYYNYQYVVNDKVYSGSTDESNIKSNLRTIDTLRKFDCVRIEYSRYFPFFSKLADQRILRK